MLIRVARCCGLIVDGALLLLLVLIVLVVADTIVAPAGLEFEAVGGDEASVSMPEEEEEEEEEEPPTFCFLPLGPDCLLSAATLLVPLLLLLLLVVLPTPLPPLAS